MYKATHEGEEAEAQTQPSKVSAAPILWHFPVGDTDYISCHAKGAFLVGQEMWWALVFIFISGPNVSLMQIKSGLTLLSCGSIRGRNISRERCSKSFKIK